MRGHSMCTFPGEAVGGAKGSGERVGTHAVSSEKSVGAGPASRAGGDFLGLARRF